MATAANGPFSGPGYRLGSRGASSSVTGSALSGQPLTGTIRFIRRSLFPFLFNFTPTRFTSSLQNHFGKITLGAGLIGHVFGNFYYSAASPAASWILGSGLEPLPEGSTYEKISFAVLTAELAKLGYDFYQKNWLDSAIDVVAIAKLCHIIYTNNQKPAVKK